MSLTPGSRLGSSEILAPIGEGGILGRDAEANARVDHASVSRRHARISFRSKTAALDDLGSRNGMFRVGNRVERPQELADGDVIGLGPVTLVFERLGAAGTTESDLARY